MEPLRITKKQLSLLAQTGRVIGFTTYEVLWPEEGWIIVVEISDQQKLEVRGERGQLRVFKQLSAVARFIREAVPTAKKLEVILADDDSAP